LIVSKFSLNRDKLTVRFTHGIEPQDYTLSRRISSFWHIASAMRLRKHSRHTFLQVSVSPVFQATSSLDTCQSMRNLAVPSFVYAKRS
jgi:hypothetical protein